MGLTERHWFEDEEPELTERQLEDVLSIQDRFYRQGYHKGYDDRNKEIVRCKDCKKYGDNKKCPIEALINSNSKQFFAFDKNWFCADGERKEDR